MAEMLIQTPEVKKTLNDYDILFETGMMMPITVDLDMGDTISFDDHAILVHLVSKPSLNDPTKLLPAEDITIFTKHIASIQHRTREIVELNPEQRAQWYEEFKTMNASNSTLQ